MYAITTYFWLAIIVFVIVCLIVWWAIGVYNVEYPGPARPDADFRGIIDEFNSFPKELWFRNNPCVFDEWLTCRYSRYIVYLSSGVVVYDSINNPKWKEWAHKTKEYKERHRNGLSRNSENDDCECNKIYYESARQLTTSVEYNRAAVLTQGVIARGKLNNICELVKQGDFVRIVHVSQYIYDESDPAY